MLLKRLPQRNVQQSWCQGGCTQRPAPSLSGGSSLPVLPIKSKRLPVGTRVSNIRLKLAKLPFQHRAFQYMVLVYGFVSIVFAFLLISHLKYVILGFHFRQ